MDLTRIIRISSLSRLQGPAPAPSQMKDIQQAEYQVFPTAALISPLYIIDSETNMNFEVFCTRKLITSMLTEELKSFQKSDQKLTINITPQILDVCMQNTLYTAGSRHMNFELFT